MYKKKICTELNNTSEGNPKHFWKLLNKLSNQSKGNNHSDENIPKEEFIKFYKDLNTSHNEQSDFHNDIINEFNALQENVSSSSLTHDLNKPISTEEIPNAIKSLHSGKSTSTDMISNEMLKKCSTNINKTTT